ncbi:unnamed protein product, partial [Oppiella nova]
MTESDVNSSYPLTYESICEPFIASQLRQLRRFKCDYNECRKGFATQQRLDLHKSRRHVSRNDILVPNRMPTTAPVLPVPEVIASPVAVLSTPKVVTIPTPVLPAPEVMPTTAPALPAIEVISNTAPVLPTTDNRKRNTSGTPSENKRQKQSHTEDIPTLNAGATGTETTAPDGREQHMDTEIPVTSNTNAIPNACHNEIRDEMPVPNSPMRKPVLTTGVNTPGLLFKPFKCNKCNISFKRGWQYSNHQQAVHSLLSGGTNVPTIDLTVTPKRKAFRCDNENCGKEYKSQFSLNSHKRKRHDINGNIPALNTTSIDTQVPNTNTTNPCLNETNSGIEVIAEHRVFSNTAFTIPFGRPDRAVTDQLDFIELSGVTPDIKSVSHPGYRGISTEKRDPTHRERLNTLHKYRDSNEHQNSRKSCGRLTRSPLKCNYNNCGQSFDYESALNHHKLYAHNIQQPYVCEYDGCGTRFFDAIVFNAHKSTAHRPPRVTSDLPVPDPRTDTELDINEDMSDSNTSETDVIALIAPDVEAEQTITGLPVPTNSNSTGGNKSVVNTDNNSINICINIDFIPLANESTIAANNSRIIANSIENTKTVQNSQPMADKQSSNKKAKSSHKSSKSKLSDPNEFKCDFKHCRKVCRLQSHLNQHKQTAHNISPPFVCDYVGCHQRFCGSNNLDKHKRMNHSYANSIANVAKRGTEKLPEPPKPIDTGTDSCHNDSDSDIEVIAVIPAPKTTTPTTQQDSPIAVPVDE